MINTEEFAPAVQMLATEGARLECRIEGGVEDFAESIEIAICTKTHGENTLCSLMVASDGCDFGDLEDEEAQLRDRQQISLGRLMAAGPDLLHELLELRLLAARVYEKWKEADTHDEGRLFLQNAIIELNDVATGTNPLPQFGKVASDIRAERLRQDGKWGEQNLDPLEWLAILGEEIGESNQAALHDRFGGSHAGTLREELVHAAAVTSAFIECLDRNEGKPV